METKNNNIKLKVNKKNLTKNLTKIQTKVLNKKLTKNQTKDLIIIAGVTGEIGIDFANYYSKEYRVIGISRTGMQKDYDNFEMLNMDLLNPEDVVEKLDTIDFDGVCNVTVLHSIGVDKFENTNYPKIEPINTIDEDVYNSNVNTFKNLVRPLIEKIEELREDGNRIKLKLSMIASIADKHDVLMLTSFSESKNIVRSYMRNLSNNFSWVSAFVINVSSTVTKSALEVRPFSDTKYWLTSKDIVSRSAKRLMSSKKEYTEIDVFKKNPAFEKDYFSDNAKIFKRWAKFCWNKDVSEVVTE